MDCDLQDDPKSFKSIIDKLKEGNDVYSQNEKKEIIPSEKQLSRLYNFVIRVIGDKKYDIDVGSMLGAFERHDEYLKLKDKDRLYVQLFMDWFQKL